MHVSRHGDGSFLHWGRWEKKLVQRVPPKCWSFFVEAGLTLATSFRIKPKMSGVSGLATLKLSRAIKYFVPAIERHTSAAS